MFTRRDTVTTSQTDESSGLKNQAQHEIVTFLLDKRTVANLVAICSAVTKSVGFYTMIRGKGKAWRVPLGSRRLRLPPFLDIQHMKVVKLSAVSTGRLNPQEISLVLILVGGREDSRNTVRPDRLSK